MKKLGKEVLMLPRVKNNMRNGEGSFLRLKDGRILYAYTKYYGDGYDDHHQAYIAATYSSDEGETWSEPEVFFEKAEDEQTIMSVSLMRMENGDIGFFYGQKKIIDGYLFCRPVFRRSADEGKTFSEPTFIIESGYSCLINDRVTRLKSGRIILTTCKNGEHVKVSDDNVYTGFMLGYLEIYYSDDDGRTFQKAAFDLCSTYGPNAVCGLQEPGILARGDGLYLWMRTEYGCQYESLSTHGLDGFGEARPSVFSSPRSPMQMKEYDGVIYAVYNPIPRYNGRVIAGGTSGRTPLVIRKSVDGGRTWSEPVQLFENRGGAPAHIMRHSSGAIIVSVGYRDIPFGIKVYVSFDEAETFEPAEYVYNAEYVKPSWNEYTRGCDIGYASTVELNDGSLITVFYAYPDEEGSVIMQQRWKFKE